VCNPSCRSAAFYFLIVASGLMACGLLGLIGSPESASASEGPVAAYSFDAGEGESAEDLTGNEHTATLEGATWSRGKYGSGLSFDGENDCVTVPESPDFELTEEFTLEAWVKLEGSVGEDPVISKEAEGEDSYGFGIAFFEGGKAEGFIGEGEEAYEYVSSSEAIEPKAWTHIAFTYDGAHMRIYVHGELTGTHAMSQAPLPSTGPLTIGCDEAFGEHLQGKIDEVQVYNRVLDGGEVQADKSAPLQTPQQGPVAAYSFDAGEGETAEDLSGNEHTATIEGATWARGRYGSGLSFDGENDCVSIEATPDLQLTEEFTLEAWVRPTGSGEEANPFLTMEDEGAAPEEEEPWAYTFLAGENEVPKAWVRKSGEAGFQGIYGTEPLPEHAWAHLALTDDGAKLRLYVDGELVRTTAAPDVSAATGPLELGCAFGSHFEGRLDELRIYNRVLDGGELAADKAAPLQTPQQGPVAAYSFDAGEGETAEDLTGNGHDGTIEGASWARGKYGSGMEFDGENDCVSIEATPDLQLTEEFTLEAWVRPTGAGEEANPFLTMEDEGAGEEEEPWAYTFLAGENEVPKAWVRKSGEEGFQGIYGTEPLPEHAWAHLALTDDGAKLRLYVDGELVRTTAAPDVSAASGPLELGCAFGSHFEGRLDELRLYNRVLDGGELAADKSAPLQTPQQGPVAAYSFDAGEGETAEDLSGNEHTATIEGATWARGRYGSGLEFDGENDCVSIEATPDLQLTEEFTLEAWVRPTGAGAEANPFLTMEDEGAGEEEEPWAYTFLAGENEVPKAWVRKSGEAGFQGIYGTEPLPEHAWAHLALTDDGAKLRLYVDGELVRTTAAPDVSAASGPLEVGCAFGSHFEGRLDELRLYNRVLGETELRETMRAPLPIAVTEAATDLGANDAILTGTLEANGPETEYSFEYGPTTTYGNSVTGEELESEPEKLEIDQAIIDLEPETAYHYRLTADSPSGTSYGKDRLFVTGNRALPVSEEQEIREAEERSELTPKAKKAGAGDFYGMMWTGDLAGMIKQNDYQVTEESGAKWIKLPVGLNFPENATLNAFKEAEAHHLIILPGMGGGAFPRPETTLRKEWLKYAAETVEKYGPNSSYNIKTWEIWNEPNMPHPIRFEAGENEEEKKEKAKLKSESIEKVNPEAFAGFFGEMATVMRAAAEEGPNKEGIEILAPGLFGYRSPGCHPECHLKPRRFMTVMNGQLGGPTTSAYDALNLHPYVFKLGEHNKQHRPENHDIVQLVEAIHQSIVELHDIRKDQPIWITELGFPVANLKDPKKFPPVTLSVQKLAVKASFAMMQSNRVLLKIPHAFYYDLQDISEPSWDYHSGLLDLENNKRPAWTAYKCLAEGKSCS
jgi:hypothetical protein